MDLDLHAEFRRTGSIRARNKLVTDNLRIVYKMLRPGTPNYDDLVQAGIIGLIRAIEKFDPTKGTDHVAKGKSSFYIFAKWSILYEIQVARLQIKGVSRRLDRAKYTQEDIQAVLGGALAACDHLATDARLDVLYALRDATPDDLEAISALAEGASVQELAEGLGMRGSGPHLRAIAQERARAAVDRARTILEGQ